MHQYTGIIVSLATLFMVGCAAKGEKNHEEDLKVLPVTTLVTTDTSLYRSYVTDIEAVQNVEIRARVNGFLDKIYVDEGQAVKKGQLLFGISDAEYRAELAKAKAVLTSLIAESRSAALEAERVKLLVDKKVIVASELEVVNSKLAAAQAKIEEARSAVANAEMHLSFTSIRAPFDGVIDRIPLKKGSLITEGTLLTSVSDTREVFAYFNVSETEYLQYSKSISKSPHNQQVSLVLADGTNYQYPGQIETVEAEFEENTGSIAFRAKFPNPSGLLKHGASGKVRLTTAVDSAVIIPQKAVFEMQDKNYVFVVDASNKVKMKNFIPQARFAHFYIVESGLEPGERIVCEGVRNIRDGIQISPRKVPMDSLLRL
ncbi:membrane fusion protein (multidrug efflux system) [Chitinophaga terrae (ex Kim and Jung 2007)]|uniref:efflux RND transporter periplasmic adaptor subunit n=1 Tax=Chitinophaga terrae (ex Kim and Jung 2007) TaxID=408074 RepID=UPI0027829929|nr:efflux RND transporter periplasmic adaptor subunit [Chitinophaga terrae (ex Kim and Jung 2007)]MDQ0108570.1 membrane fusion protein (multidrug efflux system) [Chitinophaga terrae (ex Kim and Jung 2007)]